MPDMLWLVESRLWAVDMRPDMGAPPACCREAYPELYPDDPIELINEAEYRAVSIGASGPRDEKVDRLECVFRRGSVLGESGFGSGLLLCCCRCRGCPGWLGKGPGC